MSGQKLLEDGVFAFLKPPGITSHDAVGIARRILKIKRIGHSGTLDPMAMGVLPIFVGKATRLIEYTDDFTKTYVAEGLFGLSTDTEDITGNILSKVDYREAIIPTWEELNQACQNFVGQIKQKPSCFSAIKVNGKKSYELAREGIFLDLPARDIEIRKLELLAYKFPYFTIKVECSGGTYIRALLRDIFATLGSLGTMSQLTRTKVGPFSIENAITGEELEDMKHMVLHPAEVAVAHLDKISFSPTQVLQLKQGKRIACEEISNFGFHKAKEGCFFRSYEGNNFLGIVSLEKNYIRVSKNIFIS